MPASQVKQFPGWQYTALEELRAHHSCPAEFLTTDTRNRGIAARLLPAETGTSTYIILELN
jgi:hypothetical protein